MGEGKGGKRSGASRVDVVLPEATLSERGFRKKALPVPRKKKQGLKKESARGDSITQKGGGPGFPKEKKQVPMHGTRIWIRRPKSG